MYKIIYMKGLIISRRHTRRSQKAKCVPGAGKVSQKK